jgi:hypothetical protein
MIPFKLASNLNRTWIVDLDGTVFKHNGFRNGEDILLPGVKELWESFLPSDMIIIVTAREKKYKEITLKSLEKYKLRFDHIIFDAPTGERVIINDTKPQGLKTAIAWNVTRDKGYEKI